MMKNKGSKIYWREGAGGIGECINRVEKKGVQGCGVTFGKGEFF